MSEPSSRRARRALQTLSVVLAITGLSVCVADETSITLKEGDGVDLVRARCAACHSLDYIQMNSTFLKRSGWEGEVRKMVRVMGAPITDEEAARIVDYLGAHYAVAD